jgi:UDP-3-O-[3-hydroxymyristoyl] glucosamine N-acyltransferase
MIPDNLHENQASFRIMQSTLIGLPSPDCLRSDKFPGIQIGSEPVIGDHCLIFANVFIGNGFRCGDHVLIRENTAIGDGVTIGNRSCLDTDIVLADHVTIGDEVMVPRSTWIGCGVDIGTKVRFLSGPVVASPGLRKDRCIILEDGCSIGNDAIIGPGVCIGAGAHVEAGVTVTENVPPDVQRLNSQ